METTIVTALTWDPITGEKVMLETEMPVAAAEKIRRGESVQWEGGESRRFVGDEAISARHREIMELIDEARAPKLAESDQAELRDERREDG